MIQQRVDGSGPRNSTRSLCDQRLKSKGSKFRKQVSFHSGDDIGDLKEQLAEVKQRLDNAVNEVWKMKMQTGAWPLGDVRLRQDSVSEPRQDLGHRKL